MSAADDIRRWAMALPAVEERRHGRFGTAVWKVAGRTFLGLGKGATTAVFCVREAEANAVAAAEPECCAAVRRLDARRSFLGLQADLARMSRSRIRDLTESAWRQQAPKRLAAGYDRDSAGSP